MARFLLILSYEAENARMAKVIAAGVKSEIALDCRIEGVCQEQPIGDQR